MSEFKLSCRVKEAQEVDAAVRTAQSLFKIFQFMFHRVPQQSKRKFYLRLKGKIIRLSPSDIGMKDMPASSAIGQAIGFTKNILFGLNPMFVKRVMMELTKLLSTPPLSHTPKFPGQ